MNRRRSSFIRCILGLLGCAGCVLGDALTWTNTFTQGLFSVEWAPAAGGPWMNSWAEMANRPASGSVVWVLAPQYFRATNYPVLLDWVVVSNAHNAADSTGHGAVHYPFRISRHEIDNEQYAVFLNAVDPAGANTYGLYNPLMGTDDRGGITKLSSATNGAKYVVRSSAYMHNKPVNFVSFWDACRFCNWLHNGMGTNSTETGAYNLQSASPGNLTVVRDPAARYFLPNEDEWYKAAYYDPTATNYWLYPVRTHAAPTQALVNAYGTITNTAAEHLANYNFSAVWNNVSGNVSTVGSGGPGSQSAYGAADMAGNLDEWIETIASTNYRVYRGGSWADSDSFLRSSCRNWTAPGSDFSTIGFRIAAPLE